MSRLDSFIRRMQAQRACLDRARELLGPNPGIIFELGLGNGRTYDHLRERFPGCRIVVFDRKISAHPACIPPEEDLLLGEIEQTLPAAARRFRGQVALAHSDIGSGDREANRRLARTLSALLPEALAPGALVLSDQEMPIPGGEPVPLPPEVAPGRYHMLRVGSRTGAPSGRSPT